MSNHKQLHTKRRSSKSKVRTTQSEFANAYERRLKEILAVPDEALVPLNFDAHAAIAVALGALPQIEPLRAAMAKLPGIDMTRVSALDDYAEAAGEACILFDIATAPPEEVVALNKEALEMRQTFHVNAEALARMGLIDPARLEVFAGQVGYKNVAYELGGWANLFQEYWPALQGKTPLTLEDIEKAKLLAEELVRTAGEREQAPTAGTAAALIRRRAMTLLSQAYDETRRGVAYLRWRQGDVDAIVPSLYGTRTHRHEAPPAPEPSPVPPVPTPPVSALH